MAWLCRILRPAKYSSANARYEAEEFHNTPRNLLRRASQVLAAAAVSEAAAGADAQGMGTASKRRCGGSGKNFVQTSV